MRTPSEDKQATDGDPTGARSLYRLTDTVSADPALSGSKAARLAQLLQAGFPVPDGVIVATRALAQPEARMSDGHGAGYGLRENVPTPPPTRTELAEALAGLGSGPFAVRSSSSAEDLAGASFAGQYDTLLNVNLEDVEQAVRHCLASADGEQVRRYRESRNLPAASMAVLIQPMIAADAAGVAFTANPVTGDREEVVVSAVRGLGERLVSGQAAPDEWLVRHQSARAVSTPERAIDVSQVLSVAALARRVEAFYGTPQDIEWALVGNTLYLLQARPVTALNRESGAEPAVLAVPPPGYWERETSHYPEPLSPATTSTYIPAMNHAMRLMCDQMSLMIETLEQRDIGGWIYQRTVPLGGKDRRPPPAWLMPLLIRIVPTVRARIAGAVHAIRTNWSGHLIQEWTRTLKPELIGRIAQLGAVPLADLSDRQLAEHLKETLCFLDDCTDKHMLLNGAIQLTIAEYAFACRDWLGWDEVTMMLVFGGLSTTSSAPSRALSELASWAGGVAPLVEDLQKGVSWSDMQRLHPEFVRRITGYLDVFGRRSMRCELAYPSLAETPELLLQLVRDQLSEKNASSRGEESPLRQRLHLLTKAEEQLRTRPESDQQRFGQLLARAETAYPAREEHGFYDRDAPLALLRYAWLEAGRRLVRQKQLDGVEDAFFLEKDEILGALEDKTPVREVVDLRRAQRRWIIAHPGPSSYGEAPPPPPSVAAFPAEARLSAEATLWAIDRIFATRQSGIVQQDASRLTGIAASTGRYTGTVRVIRSEAEFCNIQPGDVLVCPITSPVWSILFPVIGALVTDSGGILSHSAIIAREYSLPAVVATGQATSLLRDGQRVTVDGALGVVEMHEPQRS